MKTRYEGVPIDVTFRVQHPNLEKSSSRVCSTYKWVYVLGARWGKC